MLGLSNTIISITFSQYVIFPLPIQLLKVTKMNVPKSPRPCIILLGCLAMVRIFNFPSAARAQDWEDVDLIQHSVYQAVEPDGTSAYTGGFPIKLRGVVLNNTDDWLDPTAAYDPGVHLWELGGQAEVYVQAVDLPGAPWDNGYKIDLSGRRSRRS